MCPDPALPAPTTETVIDPPSRRIGDAVRAALLDRRDYLQGFRADLLADLQRQHDNVDAKTADILDVDAQLAELGAAVIDVVSLEDVLRSAASGSPLSIPPLPSLPDLPPLPSLLDLFGGAAIVDERGPERITLPAGAQVIPNNGSATMSDEQLADLAAARGLTVVDVEQHRWLQGVATRAGAMAGSRETAHQALHQMYSTARSTSKLCGDILDYLAGGR